MVVKRAKKAISRAKKALKGDKDKDMGPDLPSISNIPWVPYPGILAGASQNPVLAGLVLGYTAAEKTQPWWGPPVAESGKQAGQAYGDWYERTFEPLFGLPGVPLQPGQVAGGPAPKRTRRVTKANKATKMAWEMLRKRMKGKMTKDKCQKLLKKCSMMASKANPNTKSRIGKGKNQTCKDCRKIRKTIWGTTKRN